MALFFFFFFSFRVEVIVLMTKINSHHQTLKTKQRMLKEDWEFFKQRRFIEEQVKSN